MHCAIALKKLDELYNNGSEILTRDLSYTMSYPGYPGLALGLCVLGIPCVIVNRNLGHTGDTLRVHVCGTLVILASLMHVLSEAGVMCFLLKTRQ